MKIRQPALIASLLGIFTLIAVGCSNTFMEKVLNAVVPVYTVTFESNGGGDIEPQFIYGGQKAIRPRNPNKGSQGFFNWYSNAALTKRYYFSSPLTADITLYAKWDETRYTVTFNSRGGNPVGSEYVGEGGTSSGPVTTRTGYVFNGWYSDADLTAAWNTENDPVTGNMTLYAKWTPITYTVKYNKNESTATGSMPDSTHTYDVEQSLNYNSFTRTGYKLSFWVTEEGVRYENGQSVSNLADTQGAIITLYAQWTPITYTVEYYPNGGNGYMEPSIYTYDNEEPLRMNEFTYPANPDVRFLGWARTPGGAVAYGNGQLVKNLASTQDDVVPLYALWAYSYIVRFVDEYGASGSPPSEMRVQAGSPITIPGRGTLSLDGYTFSGWSGYAEGASFTPLEDTTLYAQWTYNYLDYYIDFEGQQSSTVYIGSIFRSSLPNVLRLYVADPSSYTSYEWYIDGNTIPSTNSSTTSVTINANAYSVDQHIICVVAKNGNYRYSKNIEFRVQ